MTISAYFFGDKCSIRTVGVVPIHRATDISLNRICTIIPLPVCTVFIDTFACFIRSRKKLEFSFQVLCHVTSDDERAGVQAHALPPLRPARLVRPRT